MSRSRPFHTTAGTKPGGLTKRTIDPEQGRRSQRASGGLLPTMTRRPPGVTRSHKIQTLPKPERPTREDALRAVETLIRWAGDDPSREGLLGTPDRVVKSYEEFFEGYAVDPDRKSTRLHSSH